MFKIFKVITKKRVNIPIENDFTFSNRHYILNRVKAKLIIKERVKLVNEKYDYLYNKISIKNQKSRWGSCSKNKNLNFNYKIAFLPTYLMDYVIAHELCHLKEFNHSRNFWKLVAKFFPNYKELRAELKKYLI